MDICQCEPITWPECRQLPIKGQRAPTIRDGDGDDKQCQVSFIGIENRIHRRSTVKLKINTIDLLDMKLGAEFSPDGGLGPGWWLDITLNTRGSVVFRDKLL